VPLTLPVRVAGSRWRMEEFFQPGQVSGSRGR
jgi:hypothetical protein